MNINNYKIKEFYANEWKQRMCEMGSRFLNLLNSESKIEIKLLITILNFQDKTIVKENNQNIYKKENYEYDYNLKKHSEHKKWWFHLI